MGIFTTKKEIGPETVLQRRNDILFNEIDGEVVMLSIENGEYYGMDKVAARIWSFLEKPKSFQDLILAIKQYYDVSDEVCIKDTITFITKLKEKKLITVS